MMTIATGALQSIHETLRRLADHADAIVWEISPDGRFLYLDPDSLGRRASIDGANISDWLKFVHPEDVAALASTVERARRNAEKYRVEYRVVCSDGSIRWILSTGAPRFSEDGALTSYIGSLLDVSELHESRAKLILSNVEHRLLTENAGDLIAYTDQNDVYRYVSPSHKDVLGYDPEEMIGTRTRDYVHPDDLKAARGLARSEPNPQRQRLVTVRARHKNGEWMWFGTNVRKVRDPDTGQLLGTVGVARDITAQVQAQRELAHREERFRSLTSLSSDWYWEIDDHARYTFLSEGLRTRLNLDPATLLGKSVDEISTDPTDPGFLEWKESVAARRAFHDLVFSVGLSTHPDTVRYVRSSGEPFFSDGVFRGFRGVTRDVTKEFKASKAFERLATYDTLTGLPNRTLFETRLTQRTQDRRGDVAQAVFFIDLDRFKEVNDTLGHKAGDRLLKEIAARLERCVRPDDIVARLGGDEFVVLANCKYGKDSAIAIAEKLIATLDPAFIIEQQEVRPGASIGICMYPQDGLTSEILLQNADTALYRAKADGRGRYCFFTSELGVATKTRVALHTALRHAIERNEFEVHYQPRVNLDTMQITGAEALLRWTHPELGKIPPSEFIPLAEESGSISEIGIWVLQRAAEQMHAWNARHGTRMRVSVNLSWRQLRDKNLVECVSRVLQESGLAPDLLELEITESGLMEDADLAASVLQELKNSGIHLSVDDFGTGYSSLAYLWRFPLDCLKLDRSFLHHSPLKLGGAIINLAHTLNLSVVAEGVETEEQLEFLRAASCDEIQGYLISRPLPSQEFDVLLRETLERRKVRF